MPITTHVTSLELSRRLKELGVLQKSLFIWSYYPHVDNYHSEPEYNPLKEGVEQNGLNISAYLASELDQLIARATNGEYAFITNEEQTMGYRVYEPIMESEGLKLTRTGYKLEVIKSAGIMDENHADCRAKMLIHLLENHLISVEELGK